MDDNFDSPSPVFLDSVVLGLDHPLGWFLFPILKIAGP